VIRCGTTKSILASRASWQAIGAHNLKDGVQRGFAFDLRIENRRRALMRVEAIVGR